MLRLDFSVSLKGLPGSDVAFELGKGASVRPDAHRKTAEEES